MKLIYYYYNYYYCYYYSGTPNRLYPFYDYNKTFWQHCVSQTVSQFLCSWVVREGDPAQWGALNRANVYQ